MAAAFHRAQRDGIVVQGPDLATGDGLRVDLHGVDVSLFDERRWFDVGGVVESRN